MLDVGFSEILLTSAIALVVLGPERLPKVARQVGNWMGRARAMARQLSEQLEREVSAEEFLKAQKQAAPPQPIAPQPTIAPPPTVAPHQAAEPLVGSSAAAVADASPGLPAHATTPAAMHPSEAQAAEPPSPHE